MTTTSKKTKSTKATKSTRTVTRAKKTPEVTAVVSEPVMSVTASTSSVTTEVEVEVEVEVETWKTSLDKVVALQATLVSTLKEFNTELKSLTKRVEKEMKVNSKKRKKTSSVKRAPSGFAKPALISVELCDFLGKPKGTEMARTEVTKLLTQYVRDHNLQDPENKRTIVPDARLQKLLNVTTEDTVTYFNLQKHMKPHFPKSAAATAAAASAAASASASASVIA
tara:strand:- start:3880 stop:4551 length:672 start_codon:yes stop_codon:yes gene_type:complete